MSNDLSCVQQYLHTQLLMCRPLQHEGRAVPGSVYFYVLATVGVEIKRLVTPSCEKKLRFTECYGLQQNFLPDINFSGIMIFTTIIISS